MTRQRSSQERSYDVCLSFAGEDRVYVAAVADALLVQKFRVFYDGYEEATLWGKDLYQHLDDVYRNKARFCVLFISSAYVSKNWTIHELASAQARALTENREYILPARFDDTEIPGLRPTTAYLDLRNKTPQMVASTIATKLRTPVPKVVKSTPQSTPSSEAGLKRARLIRPTLRRR